MSRTPAAPLLHGDASLRHRLPLARRSTQRELLDESDLDPLELAANLGDLTRLNRLPGGAGASIAAIERLTDGARRLSLLDLGTGAGDLPIAFVTHARRHGLHWEVTAVDNRPEILAHAAAMTEPEAAIRVLLADARRLPMAGAAVDVAHASLLLHHLDDDAAVACLAEMRRVARRGVVVNDLRRGIGAFLIGAPIVLAVGRSRMTRHDGVVSLRRAHTLAELDALLDAAGLRSVWRSHRLLPRVVTAAVPA